MKKKFMLVAVSTMMICVASACGSAKNAEKTTAEMESSVTMDENTKNAEGVEETTTETPTGYAEDEAQRICVQYNDMLYVYDDEGRVKMEESEISTAYPEFTKKEKVINDSDAEPKENLHAAHITDGALLFANPEKTDTILVYNEGEILTMVVSE